MSSMLFGGISCSFLPYSERQDIAINNFILSLLPWILSRKRYFYLFCLGIKSSGYNHTQFTSVLSEISQKRIHM